jgi:hypothetical protein
LGEASVSVEQQRPRQLGEAQVEERENEEFVPEHVPAVGLTVKAASRNTDVEFDRVR